jgi:hypothetical protein
MSNFELEAHVDGFKALATLAGTRITVVFSGSGDRKAIELLAGYLKQVHEEALRLSVTEVSCDFRELRFMNSSCFKSFVVWIDSVKGSPNPYKIRFLTDSIWPWQRRSLEALRRLAANIVSIDADSAS